MVNAACRTINDEHLHFIFITRLLYFKSILVVYKEKKNKIYNFNLLLPNKSETQSKIDTNSQRLKVNLVHVRITKHTNSWEHTHRRSVLSEQ